MRKNQILEDFFTKKRLEKEEIQEIVDLYSL